MFLRLHIIQKKKRVHIVKSQSSTVVDLGSSEIFEGPAILSGLLEFIERKNIPPVFTTPPPPPPLLLTPFPTLKLLVAYIYTYSILR